MMRINFLLVRNVVIAISAIACTLCAGAQGNNLHDPEEYLSRTLPVLYITTEDSVPITSRDYYLQGTYYLDSQYCDRFESIGSAEEPLALQIKGRGNSSWA